MKNKVYCFLQFLPILYYVPVAQLDIYFRFARNELSGS